PSAAVRASYDLSDRPFFLYPANTYPHKNHAVLVEAMAQLVDHHPEALLVLTGGTASAEPALEAEVFRRNLTAHVRRPGRVPEADLEGLFAEATALVFPSRYEGFGAPIVEAMQRRCPVIGADTTAVPEVAGGAALLVDPDDPEGWAAAMATVLEDPGRRALLAEAGTARAHAFAPDRAAAALEAAYGRVLR
ncbi:MAG: glycosyltransferase family 4 protein, partial [Actinomycetota bacterium]